MSIYRVTKNDYETFTVTTNPFRTYVSSSTMGTTGSVHVFPRRSTFEKETAPVAAFIDVTHDDSDINSAINDLKNVALTVSNAQSLLSARFNSMMFDYLTKVNDQSISVRKFKTLDIYRFTPSYNFTANTSKKLHVKNLLNKYYKTSYPTAQWAYSNYHSLNFFTSSTVPTGSALLYPNIDGGHPHDGYVSGVYGLSGAFSFDFYINPRYQTDIRDGQFKAGTIFHLSSSYAVSLVSGSAKDENGRQLGFRIQLQLSHSADYAPSVALPGAYPKDLIFLSDDNSLWHNKWHHVVIRWGTNIINRGTGSFNVDGVDKGTFVVPSGTIAPLLGSVDPKVLVVGNFYEGWDDMTKFFASDPALRDGLEELYSAVSVEEPDGYKFSHPLNAEVHDLSIKRFYMTNADIAYSASIGPKMLDHEVAFYLPPFFVEETPLRQFVGDHGGILQTPFFEVDGTTNDSFNVALSFGVGGHYINIENFLRDFASNVFPRVHLMTGSAIPYTTTARSANEFLYDDPLVRRRNTFLLPCDDGAFVPSFELLASESLKTNIIDDLGVEELSFIHLDNMLNENARIFGTSFDADDKTIDQINAFANEQIGFTPELPGIRPGPAYVNYIASVNRSIADDTFDPGIQNGAPLTIYQRTFDPSSNQVTFFEISNLFYGKRIMPKSLLITDSAISGSGGRISITLKDDGLGNVYRADCLTSQSTWNSVGNIYYDEGIIVIKSPHLYFFGKEGYEISFRGEQNIHVSKFEILAPGNQLNQSTNPNFKAIKPSGYENDPDDEFVYITGLNFHDNNYNVVMKAQMAQPIVKRHGERIMFRVKMDW